LVFREKGRMMETVIVIGIIGTTGLFLCRSIYNALSGRKEMSTCHCNCECPLLDTCKIKDNKPSDGA